MKNINTKVNGTIYEFPVVITGNFDQSSYEVTGVFITKKGKPDINILDYLSKDALKEISEQFDEATYLVWP